MALVLCTGIDPSVVRTRQLILERAGHVVVPALDEHSLIAACQQNKFEVALPASSANAAVTLRCWNSIPCPAARSLKMQIHGWRFLPMFRRNSLPGLKRLPPNDRRYFLRQALTPNHKP